MDGGRVLKAYLWRRSGDSVRASVGAARAGRILAFVLIALGLVEFLAGALVGGVWLAFIQRYLLGDRHSAYPVADRDGSIIGLITLAQLRATPPSQRADTLVREAAMPLPRVPTAAPDEPLAALLERRGPTAGNRALVLDSDRLVGIVTASDLGRLIDVYRLASPLGDLAHRH